MKCLLALIVVIPIFAFSQILPSEEQIKAVNTFYDGYNQKDYSKMRQPMSGVLKLAFSKGNLERGYGATLIINGKARIVSIKSTSEAGVAVEVTYEKDTTETQRMGFMFNNKNKFIGLSNRSNKLQYPVLNDEIGLSETIMQLKIDSILQQKFKAGVFNGCVLVMDKGKVIYKNCAGYADYENKIFLNDSSVFELASCSKQFTAIAIMILAEREKLNYTDNIKQYIPELPYNDITVENLLTHTSGLPDYEEMLDEHWDKKKFATNYDIVNLFAKYKPSTVFNPGKKYEYSNTGYTLLSVIIEKASGMSYSDFLEKNIFQPLGMTHSRVYNTRRVKNEKINNYAYGYVYSDSLRQYVLPDILADNDYVIYQDPITGDGTVNSSISDLALWEKALRDNELVSKNTIIKAFTKAKLNSGEQIDYGYGWEIQSDEKFERIVYHSGSWPGYTAYTVHFIDKEKSIAILSNNEYINIAKFAKKLGLILTEKK